jgi:hypothetical protein
MRLRAATRAGEGACGVAGAVAAFAEGLRALGAEDGAGDLLLQLLPMKGSLVQRAERIRLLITYEYNNMSGSMTVL